LPLAANIFLPAQQLSLTERDDYEALREGILDLTLLRYAARLVAAQEGHSRLQRAIEVTKRT
jgi:hypothetical protein